MKPPLGLVVQVTAADGSTTEWHDSARRAGRRPQGLNFSTKRWEGFSTGGCTLARDTARDYFDLNLVDSMVIRSVDGDIVYEGYVARLPREHDSITVETVGWIGHAQDRKVTIDYVNRDMSTWATPPLARRAVLAEAGRSLSNIQASASTSGLVFDIPTDRALPAEEIAELQYESPPGSSAGYVVYRGTRTGSSTGFETTEFFCSDLVDLSDAVTVPITLDDTVRSAAVTNATRYVTVRARKTSASSVPALSQQRFDVFAVYADHNLTLLPVGDGTLGVAGSDIIKHSASQWAPMLNTDGVMPTDYPIAHFPVRDPTSPYDIWLRVNALHLYEIAVWENRTLHWAPADLSTFDWQVRTYDQNVEISLNGDSIADLANGVDVTFTDVGTGAQTTLFAEDHPELVDGSAANPFTAHQRDARFGLTITYPTSVADALQIGRAALAEHNQAKGAGTIVVKGYIRDREGRDQPVSKVRYGDTIAITDHPNDRPRLIVETGYQHGSGTSPPEVTIATDTTLERVEAMFERIGIALQARGLS